jgi:ketosteroid isomerase-like protein
VLSERPRRAREVHVNRQEAAAWLDRYIEAWKSYDRDSIVALFTGDAEYRYHPYDGEPVRGAEAIADSWVEEERRDAPGTYTASYEPVAVDGDVVVATGTSTYLRSDGSVERVFDNCYVMRFDESGRCAQFTEWFMERPK